MQQYTDKVSFNLYTILLPINIVYCAHIVHGVYNSACGVQ